MNKKCYRYFAGAIGWHEKWLNKMAAKGWRLVGVGKLMYEWEPCEPGQYQYKVEYVGNRSWESSQKYTGFLQDCGYRTFYRGINLNWSAMKVVARPWADPGGRLAISATTYNRELLIVEKQNDGKPFELHTSYADIANSYREMRRPWAFTLLVTLGMAIVLRSPVWGILSALIVVQLIVFQVRIHKLMQKEDVQEL